ncbi:MAG: hypothetical protein DI586_01100 [Micavibrio aeruginosavorus]|uniref:Uncharacterized protein n=1 Tax=Micavibrio aeruginosavorus TaxID=349221 RepID=A0A2W5HUA8_9BACT|nr:MAG: hypothetical protein DI586_01100 [Micavibrio aeruginosavorus]
MPPSANTLNKEAVPHFETRITADSLKSWPSLRQKFTQSAALHKTPGTFEPEFKFIVPSKDTFGQILQKLYAHKDVSMGPNTLYKPKDYILLSLGMDTIDAAGNPTYAFQDHGFQYRNRMSYHPEFTQKARRFADIQANMKDLMDQDLGMRNEYEAMIPFHDIPAGLDHGVKYIIDKYESEGVTPPSFLYDVLDERLAVGEICMTSRAQHNFIHHMPDLGCSVVYEYCADSQIFSTPKADIMTGNDYEFEIEAKNICCPGCSPSDDQKMTILKTSLERLKHVILAADQRIFMSDESKLQRAARSVSDYYSSKPIHSEELSAGRDLGRDFALRLNNRPSEILYAKGHLLQRLAQAADKADTLISKDWLAKPGDMGYSHRP